MVSEQYAKVIYGDNQDQDQEDHTGREPSTHCLIMVHENRGLAL